VKTKITVDPSLFLVKVLDCCDQLPFGPHSDVVGWEKSVEDLECQWGGKFEILHRKANGSGAITDHADVRRCGKELEEARARVLVVAEAQRQRIVPQLRNNESDGWAQEGENGLTVTRAVADKRLSSIGSQWS
jgi:hypothetical protein